jgi:hypothetical protein
MKNSDAPAVKREERALPGTPYDGHTLGTIPQMQPLIDNIVDRCITDVGYCS